MQSQPDTNPSPFLQRDSSTYQNVIPWWNDLPPNVINELVLPTDTSIPSQSIDVAIIGAGVAGLSAALSAQSCRGTGDRSGKRGMGGLRRDRT